MTMSFSCVICRRPAEYRCSGCRGRFYCSEECQETDWPQHSKECNLKEFLHDEEMLEREPHSLEEEREFDERLRDQEIVEHEEDEEHELKEGMRGMMVDPEESDIDPDEYYNQMSRLK